MAMNQAQSNDGGASMPIFFNEARSSTSGDTLNSEDFDGSDGFFNQDMPRSAPVSDNFYSCIGPTHGALENAGAKQLNLAYDYEIHVAPKKTPSADPKGRDTDGRGDPAAAVRDEAVLILAGDLALALAVEYGIENCGGTSSRKRLGESRDLWGISSDPPDLLDVGIEKCTAPVDLDQPTSCTPMKGYLTAWVKPENVRLRRGRRTLSEESELMEFVEKYVAGYQSDEVFGMSYVGTRKDESVLARGEPKINAIGKVSTLNPLFTDAQETEGAGAGVKVVLPLVIGSLFVFILLGAVYLKRRKRNAKNDDHSVPHSITYEEEEEDDFVGIDAEVLPPAAEEDRSVESSLHVADDPKTISSLAEFDSLALKPVYDDTSVSMMRSHASESSITSEYTQSVEVTL